MPEEDTKQVDSPEIVRAEACDETHLQEDLSKSRAYEIEELASAQSFGLRCAVLWVCTTPALYILVQFAAAYMGLNLHLDDRILQACLCGVGVILAFGFKRQREIVTNRKTDEPAERDQQKGKDGIITVSQSLLDKSSQYKQKLEEDTERIRGE